MRKKRWVTITNEMRMIGMWGGERAAWSSLWNQKEKQNKPKLKLISTKILMFHFVLLSIVLHEKHFTQAEIKCSILSKHFICYLFFENRTKKTNRTQPKSFAWYPCVACNLPLDWWDLTLFLVEQQLYWLAATTRMKSLLSLVSTSHREELVTKESVYPPTQQC